MSTNGRTATDFSGIVGAAAPDVDDGATAGVGVARWLDSQRRSAANPAITKAATDATAIAARFGDRAGGSDAFVGDSGAAGTVVAVDACIANRTADTSFGNADSVPPLGRIQEILKTSRHARLVGTQRHDGMAFRASALYLSQDVRGHNRVLRQDEHDRFGGIDGVNDRICIEGPSNDIARRDPADDSGSLQRANYVVRNGSIL
jgi:hypothetical protein